MFLEDSSWTGRSIRPHLHHWMRQVPWPSVSSFCREGGPRATMTIQRRNLVTAFFAYFMAWSIVALPSIPIELFSVAGIGLVLAIGTPVAVIGIFLNLRAERAGVRG